MMYTLSYQMYKYEHGLPAVPPSSGPRTFARVRSPPRY